LIATPKVCNATEAARAQPEGSTAPAHDAFTRLLHRLEPDTTTLWREAAGQVERGGGVLVVEGINPITLLWSEGDRHMPVDSRLYDKAGDDPTKNDHFQALLKAAHERGFRPECAVFDSWYGSLAWKTRN